MHEGIIQAHTGAVEIGNLITWPPVGTSESEFLVERDEETVSSYLNWLRTGAFSAILADWSLIQITYMFDGDEMVGHRLAYIPFPFRSGPLAGFDAIDIIELFSDPNGTDVLLRPSVRFDYGPYQAVSLSHPHSHFSFASPDCRVPCRGPLRLGHFAQFVFLNFYPTTYAGSAYLQSMPTREWMSPTIDDAELAVVHLSWPA